MTFVVHIISGRQQWYERIFREKAVRLITTFGKLSNNLASLF